MMKRLLYALTSIALLAQVAVAQEVIKVTKANAINNNGEEVVLSIELNLDAVKLNPNDLLTITPIVSDNGQNRLFLPSIVLSGSTRQKAISRAKALHNALPYKGAPFYEARRVNSNPLSISYTQSIPYSVWMKNAYVDLQTVLSGCANCEKGTDNIRIIDKLIKEPYVPTYQLTYITPKVEPVKARADEYSAQLNFVVGKHDIVASLGNNARILEEANKVVNEVVNNPDIKITKFSFTGWASPEGNQHSNQALSERRANSFANYLLSRHGLERSMVSILGGGEDWNGVRELVDKSHLSDRTEVLRIIDSGIDYDARDPQLRRLSRGTTYQTMLRDMYPQVRRTVYKIAYEVRAFDVEEAKQIIKTNPKLLSLNEMYLVAKSYDPTSREFSEVFDIASRIYPNEPIAIINASAADIEGGNNKAAIDRMSKINTDERTWNNMGVAYARMKMYDQAKHFFEQAIDKGNEQAKHNLQELQQVIADNEK